MYYRLIALWVLIEAMLGGIIHGLRIPVSGLVVGSAAVICISLIAYHDRRPGAILKATLIVAVFKMILSPQAPPPAYIAVFFQGLMGEIFFYRRKAYPLSCMLLGVTALLESGLQRILVLTLIYGNDLWLAINQFISGVTGSNANNNFSLWIGAVYIGLHLVAGFIAGWFAAVLPGRIKHWSEYRLFDFPKKEPEQESIPLARRKKKRWLLWIIMIILAAVYIQSVIYPAHAWLPRNISLRILIRSAILLLLWYFVVGPALKKWMFNWLAQKKNNLSKEINHVSALLPGIKDELIAAKRAVSFLKAGKWKKLKLFLRETMIRTLGKDHQSYIVTNPIHSGKTSALLKWASQRNDVYGILTPIIDGERKFMDIKTGETFRMMASGDEEVFEIGNYRFSREMFDKATSVLLRDTSNEGWLIIDEIGPLEAKGQGFAEALNKLKKTNHQMKTIYVIRSGMAPS